MAPEELTFLQELEKEIENLGVFETDDKNYVSQTVSNVYIDRKGKKNTHHVIHRIEIVPPQKQTNSNALETVHQHVRTKARTSPRYEVPEAYLQYLGSTFPPETFFPPDVVAWAQTIVSDMKGKGQ